MKRRCFSVYEPFKHILFQRERWQPFLGEVLVVIAGTTGGAAQPLWPVASYTEQQGLSRCNFVRHDPVKFFQISRREPGFLVILDYQYSKYSESGNQKWVALHWDLKLPTRFHCNQLSARTVLSIKLAFSEFLWVQPVSVISNSYRGITGIKKVELIWL